MNIQNFKVCNYFSYSYQQEPYYQYPFLDMFDDDYFDSKGVLENLHL